MRPRKIIFTLLTSAAIFSLALCLSCANSNRVEGDEAEAQTQSETNVSENGAPPAENGNLSDLGEPPPADAQAQAGPDGQPPADQPPPDQPPTGDLNAEANMPPPGDQPPVADNGAPPSGDIAPPGDQAPADQPPADAPPPADQVAQNDAPPPPVDNGPVAQEPLQPERPRAVGTGKVPKIPANAIKRGKDTLNRFYFVRKGDTRKSVAELLYGNPARAKELAKWNKGEFAPGRLVYYSSPQQPEDPQMRSFYQERGVQPEEYAVGKGDTLGKIAKKRLGDGRSWKEIAVVNGIEKPGALEPGQKLAIYPLGFTGGGMASARDMAPPPAAEKRPREARNGRDKGRTGKPQPPPDTQPAIEVPAAPPIAEMPAATPPEIAPPPVAPLPPPAAEPMSPDSFRKKTKKPGPGMDIANIIQQNLFFIVIGAGVSILLLALLAVNKKRKARSEAGDFGEDGFASPRAKRR